MRAVQLTAYGNPVEGLKYVDIPEPEAPGPNQVLIGVEFSPVNPSDLLLARGIYGIRPALPSVIGGEGVAHVIAAGAGVENVKVGDRVLAPLSSFTWRERMVVPASGLFALPPGADPQQLSMLAINPPTAALLLSEYVNLKPGEWVVQNSANSSVGRWVIAFAKTRGLKPSTSSGGQSSFPSFRRLAETLSSSILPMHRKRSKRLSVRLSSAWRLTVSAARRRACSHRLSRPAARS